VVHNPIVGDDKGGRLFVFGKSDAPNVVFFCAGYPDDHGSFSALAERLAREANCLCGVACLIGYDGYKPWTSYRSQGYSFEEMTSSLRAAAKKLRQESTCPKPKYTTVFHDWGSIVGSRYTNQALEEKDSLVAPDQIVYFDVLPVQLHPSAQQLVPASKTLWESVTEVSYRIVFAKAFLIQRFFSSHLAILYFTVSFMILGVLGLLPGNPSDDFEDKLMKEKMTMDSASMSRMIYMAYPYYTMWLSVFQNGKIFDFHLPVLEETPVLFLYGACKNIQFHDKNVEAYLQEQAKKGSRSNAIAVSDAAHWLYLQQPDICFDAVKNFILDANKKE
jgi:pimeloyl-ACP methyl ester carboxylesterase